MPLPMDSQDREAFVNRQHHGFDPYERRYLDQIAGFERLPKCIHFYYMGFDGAKQDFRHYYLSNGKDEIAYSDVPKIIRRLARNAVLKDHNPPKHGIDFKEIIFRSRSYVAVLMDSPFFSVWQNGGLIFRPKNGGMENFSFFDADDIFVDVPAAAGTISRSAFFCINHMKGDAAGTDLGPSEARFYSFDLVFRLGTLEDPWEYDPGATNQGPPEDP